MTWDHQENWISLSFNSGEDLYLAWEISDKEFQGTPCFQQEKWFSLASFSFSLKSKPWRKCQVIKHCLRHRTESFLITWNRPGFILTTHKHKITVGTCLHTHTHTSTQFKEEGQKPQQGVKQQFHLCFRNNQNFLRLFFSTDDCFEDWLMPRA